MWKTDASRRRTITVVSRCHDTSAQLTES